MGKGAEAVLDMKAPAPAGFTPVPKIDARPGQRLFANLISQTSRERLESDLRRDLDGGRARFEDEARKFGAFMQTFLQSGGQDLIQAARTASPAVRAAVQDALANAGQRGEQRDLVQQADASLQAAMRDARRAFDAALALGDLEAAGTVLEQSRVVARAAARWMAGVGGADGVMVADRARSAVEAMEQVAETRLGAAPSRGPAGPGL